MSSTKVSRQRSGAACLACRARKLRCDGRLPTCSSCAGSHTVCEPSMAQARRGPKKGHIKAMLERISGLESELSSFRSLHVIATNGPEAGTPAASGLATNHVATSAPFDTDDLSTNFSNAVADPLFSHIDSSTELSNPFSFPEPIPIDPPSTYVEPCAISTTYCSFVDASLSSVDGEYERVDSESQFSTLNELYFERVHPVLLFQHKRTYYTWADSSIKSDAQRDLQNIMFALAASSSASLQPRAAEFYAQARASVDVWHASSGAGHCPDLERAQILLLLTIYEITHIDVRRGCLTASHCIRMVQWLRWHQLDILQPDICNVESLITVEEKRRVFWVSMALDRILSTAFGWPLTLNEDVIQTRLPSTEDEFQVSDMSSAAYMPYGHDAVSTWTIGSSSPLTDMVVLALISGRILEHQQTSGLDSSGERVSHRTTNISVLERIVTAAAENPGLIGKQHGHAAGADPLLVFNRILAQMNVIMFCQATSERPGEDDPAVVQELCRSVSRNISLLSRSLAEISYLRIHPLTPLPLIVCAKALSRLSCLEDFTTTKLKELQNLLRHVGSINKLASNCLDGEASQF